MNDHTGRLRIFLALDTPAEVRSELVVVRDRLAEARADVRWEAAGKLHCTLKFVGDTEPSQLEAVTGAVADACRSADPLTLTYGGLGCFPNRREPRIIWAGIQDPIGAVTTLAGAIDGALRLLGFPREQRPFHPHVTLGRVSGTHRLAGLIAMMETVTFESRAAVLAHVVLMKSELRPGGSLYTPLRTVPLGTAGGSTIASEITNQ